mmetsp:Transcript_6261/g.7163  ORF Transcript_6261/g.7163 Transcript_6261/m.7163 type:complete len:115 (-) Transcript_6261:1082-1426(-)
MKSKCVVESSKRSDMVPEAENTSRWFFPSAPRKCFSRLPRSKALPEQCISVRNADLWFDEKERNPPLCWGAGWRSPNKKPPFRRLNSRLPVTRSTHESSHRMEEGGGTHTNKWK